jgi:hypothetical protein
LQDKLGFAKPPQQLETEKNQAKRRLCLGDELIATNLPMKPWKKRVGER